jgi:ATP-dependent DNA helicase RecG
MDITYLKSVGPKRAEALNQSGIYTLEDLITYFPTAYINRELAGNINDIRKFLQNQFSTNFNLINNFSENNSSEINDTLLSSIHKEISIIATIINTQIRIVKNNKKILTVIATDSNNVAFEIIYFSSADYFVSLFQTKCLIIVSGKPTLNINNNVSFAHPEVEFIDEEDIQFYKIGGIIPRYKITEYMRKTGISIRIMRKIINYALDI